MLGSFRIRLLIVIAIIAIVGFLWQSSENSRQIVEPVLRYVMSTDYDIEKITLGWFNNFNTPETHQAVPAAASTTLQAPCPMLGIQRNYGWYYNKDQKKQEFYPGITLKVDNSTLVKPVMKGKVEKISGQGGERKVLIKHDNEISSLYGGLKEVLVEEKQAVDIDKTLGKTGTTFYFEIRNQDGPLNPQSIFAQ